MRESTFISIIVIIIYIFLILNKRKMVYVKSPFTNQSYLVRDDENKQDSAFLLSKLIKNLFTFRKHLVENKDKIDNKFSNHIDQLARNLNDSTKIYENDGSEGFTSYSVNKGEELVFCLKSKKTKKLHSLNLIMYVALHELAHIACPETGHTQLFKDIFAMFTSEAIKIGLYRNVNYGEDPVEYCGMILSSSILH